MAIFRNKKARAARNVSWLEHLPEVGRGPIKNAGIE